MLKKYVTWRKEDLHSNTIAMQLSCSYHISTWLSLLKLNKLMWNQEVAQLSSPTVSFLMSFFFSVCVSFHIKISHRRKRFRAVLSLGCM